MIQGYGFRRVQSNVIDKRSFFAISPDLLNLREEQEVELSKSFIVHFQYSYIIKTQDLLNQAKHLLPADFAKPNTYQNPYVNDV